MFFKTIFITLILKAVLVAVLTSSVCHDDSCAKQNFLKNLIHKSTSLIIYVYNDTGLDQWSVDIFNLLIPVYSVNLAQTDFFHKHDDVALRLENFYVVPVNHFDDIKDTISGIQKLDFWKSRHKIALITRKDTITAESMEDIFQYCFSYWIINVAVIFTNNLEVAYTYNPFEKKYLIERRVSEVFFDKTVNLHRFRLNISMFHEAVNAVYTHGIYEGVDGWVSRIITDTINASYDYVTPLTGLDFGYFNETYADGALGDVISNRAQFAFNSRFLRGDLLKVVEATYPHRRNDLVVLVPMERAALKNIFSTTSPTMWILIVTIAFLMFLYLYKFDKQSTIQEVIITIILLTTGRPIKEITCIFFRPAFMSSLVLVMYLTVEFNCRLTSVLTTYNPTVGPTTLTQVWKDTTYRIKSRPSFGKQLIHNLPPELRSNVKNRWDGLERETQVKEILNCSKAVMIIKKGTAKYAMKQCLMKNRNICYRFIREIFIPNILSYTVSYGSPFLWRVNNIIFRLRDNGVLDHFIKNTELRFHRSEKEHYKLSIETLYVAFIVLGVGLVASVLVFAYEYWSVYIKAPYTFQM